MHGASLHGGGTVGGSSGSSTWQGTLAKSGALLCGVVCGGAEGGGLGAAPRGWPACLDVRMRVDLTYVVHTVGACLIWLLHYRV